jgi:hypothetical protein
MNTYRFIFENDDEWRDIQARDLLDAFQYITSTSWDNAVIGVFEKIKEVKPDGIKWGWLYMRNHHTDSRMMQHCNKIFNKKDSVF